MSAAADKQLQAMEQALLRADYYGRLLDLQDSLIERGETDELPRVLDRKDRILARLALVREKMLVRGEFQGRETVNGARRVDELWKELTARMEEFSAREKESLAGAAALRDWLASQLRQLQEGKKMLGNYARAGKSGKARFKDLKT